MPTYPTVYLTVAEADALAPSVLGLIQWGTATTTEKTNALAAATRQIDTGLRYQGSRFDFDQVLEFPRVGYDNGGEGAGTGAGARGAAEVVWDWDETAGAAVVPPAVRQACLIEADEILQDLAGKSQRWRRLDEQHQGVTFDLTGSMAEAYRKGTAAAGRTGLSRRAYDLLSRYRLVSGRIV
jgi:hypothetical protein